MDDGKIYYFSTKLSVAHRRIIILYAQLQLRMKLSIN